MLFLFLIQITSLLCIQYYQYFPTKFLKNNKNDFPLNILIHTVSQKYTYY